MLQRYPAVYQDRYGEVSTLITNDGKLLRMVVRDVAFSGEDFDGLEPESGTSSAQMASFTLDHGSLCACTIVCDIPVPVVVGREVLLGKLHMHLELGAPRSGGNRGIDREDLLLTLSCGGRIFTSRGTSGGWFEDELHDLQAALPEGAYIKACINCAFSDYHPGGHGLFGGLACFRDEKEAYRTVMGKYALMQLWDRMTEFVQETYLCPEFEKRRPGAGYRG